MRTKYIGLFLLSLFMVLALTVVSFNSVLAVNPNVTRGAKPTKTLRPTEGVKPTLTESKKCDSQRERIDVKVKVYQTTKDSHFNKFEETHDMMTKLFNNLDGKGYDTVAARAKLAEMDAKVLSLKADLDKVIADLSAIKTVPCTDKKTIKKQFQTVRAEIKAVYTKEHEIVKFYKEEVRSMILALRKQQKLTPKPTKSVSVKPTKTAKPTKSLTISPTGVEVD